MELLTPNTAVTKLEQNSDSQEAMNILTGNQQERYIIERNEEKKVEKNEKKEVNSMIASDTDRFPKR